MKNIYLVLVFIFFTHLSLAQRNIQTTSVDISPDLQMELKEKVGTYSVLKLDLSKFQRAVQDKNNNSFRLKLDQKIYDFSLQAKDIRAQSFYEIRTTPNGKIKERRKKSNTFKGELQNGKFVRLTITNDFIYGIFETDSGFLVIDQLQYVLQNENIDPNYLVIYQTSTLPVNNELICGTIDNEESPSMSTNTLASSSTTTGCLILEVATDADYEYFQRYGSNSSNRILGEFNNIEGVYSNTFNLDIRVIYQHVWEVSSDPYVSSTGSTIIDEIQQTWNRDFADVNRDVVHLFTGKSLSSLYGMASGIGTVCNQSNSSSFTVDRTSAFLTLGHEIGHNLGGTHSDGISCGTTSASVMCQGPKANPIYFSSYSTTRISNYMNAYSDCLYKIDALEIVGDDIICENNSKSYTLETHIQGDIFWEISNSSIASITSGQGTPTVTVASSASYLQPVDLTVNVSNYGSSCGVQTFTKQIHFGKPEAKLTSPEIICTNQFSNGNYLLPASSGAVSYRLVSSSPELTIMGASEITLFSAPAYIDFMATSPGTYLVELFTENECGTSRAAIHVTAENCSGPGEPGGVDSYAVYPSVSSDLVTIEDLSEEKDSIAENFTPAAELRDFRGKRLKTINLQKIGKTVLSVSSLRNGHYFIIINKGHEKETHRVIVSHN